MICARDLGAGAADRLVGKTTSRTPLETVEPLGAPQPAANNANHQTHDAFISLPNPLRLGSDKGH
jgi:hypothetical protein